MFANLYTLFSNNALVATSTTLAAIALFSCSVGSLSMYSNLFSGIQLVGTADIFSSVVFPDFLRGRIFSSSPNSVVKFLFILIYANPFFQQNPSSCTLLFSTFSLIIFPVFSDVIDGYNAFTSFPSTLYSCLLLNRGPHSSHSVLSSACISIPQQSNCTNSSALSYVLRCSLVYSFLSDVVLFSLDLFPGLGDPLGGLGLVLFSSWGCCSPFSRSSHPCSSVNGQSTYSIILHFLHFSFLILCSSHILFLSNTLWLYSETLASMSSLLMVLYLLFSELATASSTSETALLNPSELLE